MPSLVFTVKFQEELLIFIEHLLLARHYFKCFICNNEQGREGVVTKRQEINFGVR